MVYGLGMYINIYHVFDGDERKASILQGWLGTVQHVGALVAVAPIVWVARRIGKSRTIALCLGCTLLGHLSKLITFRPENPWWELVSVAMLAPGVTAVFLLCNSLLADICDLDELQSGQRREGTIGAVYSWGTKVGLSLGFVLAGFALALSGFVRELGVDQDPGTMLKLRLMFACVPAAAVLGCIFLALRIKLDATAMGDVQATLLRRRAQA
jgi:GPH family glycoside/pentoside/hexuronide:cation symporter